MRTSQLIDTESFVEVASAKEIPLALATNSNVKVDSQARLIFASQDAVSRTYIHEQYVTYPFHICRAYYRPKDPPGMATICLQSTSGGIFEGDRTGVSIILKENSQAHVTTAAATVVHRMEKATAQQKVFIEAGPESFCEYLPGPLILFPKANLTSSIDVTVDSTATVIFCDSFMTHHPNGDLETFTCLNTDVCVRNFSGEVLVRDRAFLTGTIYESNAPGITGKYKAQATFMVINQRINTQNLVSMLRAGLSGLEDVYWGVSTLPSNAGAWVRMLALDGASLKQCLDLTGKLVREFMADSAPVSALD